MSTELNKKIARQLVEEILSQGNMSLVDDLLAPDFIQHEELPPGIPHRSEGFALMLTMMRSASPDFNAKVDDIIAEAEKVVVRMTWTGTQQGEFMGIPPGGKSFSIGVDRHLPHGWRQDCRTLGSDGQHGDDAAA